MTRRCTLLFRVIAALSFVPGAAQAAESVAQQAEWASSNERFRQIALQPSVGLVQYTIASDDWQRSGTRVSADLRFQKPKIPTSSQSTAQLSGIDRLSTQQTTPKRIVETRPAPAENTGFEEPSSPVRAAITVISDAVNDRQRADAAVARLKVLIAQPGPQKATTTNYEQAVVMQPAEIQPVEIPSADHASNGAIRATVEQLRLVARRWTGKARPALPRESRDGRWGREQSGSAVAW